MSLRSRLDGALRAAPEQSALVDVAASLRLVDIGRRFWPRLRPLRGWLVVGLLLLAAAPVISVAEAMLYQRLVDDVLVPAAFEPLLVLALLYVGLNLASGVVSGADDYLATYVSQRFLVDLRRDVFAHVLSLPSTTQDRRRLGDTLTRLTTDVAAVERFMVSQVSEGVGALVRLVVLVGALLWMDWQLALASLVVAPLFWWASTRFARLTRDVSRERRRRGGSLGSVTEEALGNAALVQSYGREDRAVAAYDGHSRAIAGAELAASRIRALFLPLVDLAELLGVLVVVGLGVWSLTTDRLTLGGLLAFLALLMQCFGPVRTLADLLPDLYSASAGVERVVELLDEPAGGDRADATPLPRGPGALSVREATYAYPGTSRPALDRLSLEVAAGEVVAVVGPSGSGKSTLGRLLSRQLVADSGVVAIDGHDVAKRTAASVRDVVTVVHQEQLMLDASVHDNLALGRPDATRAEVRAAARDAGAHDFVEALPHGYDTRIGQRGRSLSGGQRQRLAVARALLRPGRVLVLDEPTTGLDADAARRLMEALTTGPRDRTILVLTHDPLVLEHVDRVVRLDRTLLEVPA
ncbi:ABC transporter ATP-binding protein [Nocardioides okcheonensis]|uniref:ABC transporter ATP-binding protein n=1 Tax=Nocardioides okcheonensis TaxID=2894081 RepID=UPI001E4E1B51|nr:ABC transporter ATP-binding protein [Nocardioides okcheonensis]UFN42681.1 ABC transporter ATP-binding protein/permease [Nocardioides okcheonensis]